MAYKAYLWTEKFFLKFFFGILLTLLQYITVFRTGSGYIGELLRPGIELSSSRSCRGKLP
jgi:hypothetical protein